MKISVAMALYNSNEYLTEQLDSLRMQTRLPDEVILVDDASTNRTAQAVQGYIQKYGLKNWKLIRQSVNRGFVDTFRHALDECTGEVIFLCDHDDIWMPEKIQVMADVFEKSKGKVQALASSFIPVDKDNKSIQQPLKKGKANNNLMRRTVCPGQLNAVSFQDLAAYNIAPGCTAAVTKELADKYMSFAGRLPHDWALYAIASLEDGMFYLDRPLVRYRQHDSNTLGLTRRSAWKLRSDTAFIDSSQKKALDTLASQYGADEKVTQYMKLVKEIYRKRAAALSRKNILSLAALMIQGRSIPFFYETLAADILSAAGGAK